MNSLDQLTKYLHTVTGQSPDLAALGEDAVRGLPIFLPAMYSLFECDLFGRMVVLAVAPEGQGAITPAGYARHRELLSRGLGRPVALVLSRVAAYQRNRLVHRRVSFIVPGRQLFLPDLLVDLRERFPQDTRPAGERLTPAAQMVVLYHLGKVPVDGCAMRQLAEKVGYSPMTLSNVCRELVAAGLASLETAGRQRHLCFAAHGRALWDLAVPHLRSPVRSRRWVRGPVDSLGGTMAGMSALAAYTMINDDPLPCFAVGPDEGRRLLRDDRISPAGSRDDASALVEVWDYDPACLADGGRADRLSLFLSLDGSPDERVAGALDDLLEGMPW